MRYLSLVALPFLFGSPAFTISNGKLVTAVALTQMGNYGLSIQALP